VLKMLLDFDCDAVLFDLDGVLVDSAQVIRHHWELFAGRHQLDVQEVMRYAPGRRSAETIRLAAPHLDADIEAAELEAAEAYDTNGLAAIEGAVDLVQSIPGGGWAVATSGPKPMALTRLNYCGLPLPPVLVTADDVTQGKPDPEPYLLAARRLGALPERCLVIEDAPAGVQAGRAAGMRVIAVASTHPADELSAATVIISQLLDITILPQLNGHPRSFTVRVKRLEP
jgi:mannitol-1-/sugar-/sorbitol-6-phosphatase